jgi:hypothetical protein
MTEPERRKAPRIDRRFMVKYRCPSTGQATWMMSPIKNMSATGIRFIAEKSYPQGAVLELQLYLPTSPEPLTLEGVIVWQHGGGPYKMGENGIEFANLTPELREQLKTATEFFLRKRESG